MFTRPIKFLGPSISGSSIDIKAAFQAQTLAEEMLKQAQDLISNEHGSSRITFHQSFRLVTMMAEQAGRLIRVKHSTAATTLLKGAMAQLSQLALDEDDPKLAEGTEITWHLRVKVSSHMHSTWSHVQPDLSAFVKASCNLPQSMLAVGAWAPTHLQACMSGFGGLLSTE